MGLEVSNPAAFESIRYHIHIHKGDEDVLLESSTVVYLTSSAPRSAVESSLRASRIHCRPSSKFKTLPKEITTAVENDDMVVISLEASAGRQPVSTVSTIQRISKLFKSVYVAIPGAPGALKSASMMDASLAMSMCLDELGYEKPTTSCLAPEDLTELALRLCMVDGVIPLTCPQKSSAKFVVSIIKKLLTHRKREAFEDHPLSEVDLDVMTNERASDNAHETDAELLFGGDGLPNTEVTHQSGSLGNPFEGPLDSFSLPSDDDSYSLASKAGWFNSGSFVGRDCGELADSLAFDNPEPEDHLTDCDASGDDTLSFADLETCELDQHEDGSDGLDADWSYPADCNDFGSDLYAPSTRGLLRKPFPAAESIFTDCESELVDHGFSPSEERPSRQTETAEDILSELTIRLDRSHRTSSAPQRRTRRMADRKSLTFKVNACPSPARVRRRQCRPTGSSSVVEHNSSRSNASALSSAPSWTAKPVSPVNYEDSSFGLHSDSRSDDLPSKQLRLGPAYPLRDTLDGREVEVEGNSVFSPSSFMHERSKNKIRPTNPRKVSFAREPTYSVIDSWEDGIAQPHKGGCEAKSGKSHLSIWEDLNTEYKTDDKVFIHSSSHSSSVIKPDRKRREYLEMSSSSSCAVPEDVEMTEASEKELESHIKALAQSAPVDDEGRWMQWLEERWVKEGIRGLERSKLKCCDEYEVALFRPCILYLIHRAVVKARHCFITPSESYLSESSVEDMNEDSVTKEEAIPLTRLPNISPYNNEEEPDDASTRQVDDWDEVMQLMPALSEADEWQPWKEALREGLEGEDDQVTIALAHVGRVRDLIAICGLHDLWCAAWRRILMEDLIAPILAQGCKREMNASVLGPLLRYFSTIIPELIEPAGVASVADGCGNWKAMVCWTMIRIRCRVPGIPHGRSSTISGHDRGVFAIIRDYPYSTQALMDLAWCLEYLQMCQDKGLLSLGDTQSPMVLLAASIQLEFHRRLLIPSAQTADVLKLYLRAFSAVNILLGPERPHAAHRIFDWICEPVVTFLQGRSDTVRCVVAAMLEGSDNRTDEERPKGDSSEGMAVVRFKPRESTSSAWLELYDFETPAIPTVPAGPSRFVSPPFISGTQTKKFVQVWDERFPPVTQRYKRESTEAQMLPLLVVGVYGSEDEFIKEYRELMCQRLLGVSFVSNPQGEASRDASNLTMLKKKFGEDALQPCDVILHDVENSRKISSHIIRKLNDNHHDNPDISVLMVSRHFWPSNAGRARIGDTRHYHQQFNELRLQPQIVEDMLSRFAVEYAETCGERELVWLRTEGHATVEIIINGVTTDVICPLIALAVLALFEDESDSAWCLTRDNIQQLMGGGIDEDAVDAAIRFWTSRHVLIENPNGTVSVNE
ncbi:hypothetical protein FOL47_000247 [Perkinsus chesapeaki]|uniref:Cullin family profile domain-containing protein n=1 Tax=Perkinsus chesapeaki TaxID=330153 RepID=A0A7J6KYN0_PERCH|nr:hypothetical protein FOL47_000247 [Perkinsus chesapeaki]